MHRSDRRRNAAYRPSHTLFTLAIVAVVLGAVLTALLAAPVALYRTGAAAAAPGTARISLAGNLRAPAYVPARPAAVTALGATNNTFSGYDLTQATVCCGGGWASAPWVSATSYYNATMNSRTNLAHDTSASISSYYTLQVAVGQVVGLMCWTQTSTGTYWEKADSRHTVNGVSNLYIAYLTDTFVNVSRADLFTYVPRCSAAVAADIERFVTAAS